MWIEEVTLENVKCFQSQTIKLGDKDGPHKWVTLLGENGTGKTSVLQAIGVLLLGPNGIQKVGFWPNTWVRKTENQGEVGRIRMSFEGNSREGLITDALIGPDSWMERQFDSTFLVIGDRGATIGEEYFDSARFVFEPGNKITRFAEAALLDFGLYNEKVNGWFGAGYGAFRRLAKEGAFTSRRPEFVRRDNFNSLFKEDLPIDTLESWLMYLDHVILKNRNELDIEHIKITKDAINSLLPAGTSIEGADIDGKVWFNTPQGRVPTIALSDGYRSILALAGDLIWRMIQAFPNSEKPLEEQGVVLIDEIDIHLHPKWQRTIAGLLRKTFPNIQFIVATHSPIVAAGAGSDAVTYGFYLEADQTKVERIEHVWAQSVDDILKSPAFGLVSEFSEETQTQIDKYYELKGKKSLSRQEQKELEETYPFVREALGSHADKSDLQLKMEAYLQEKLK